MAPLHWITRRTLSRPIQDAVIYSGKLVESFISHSVNTQTNLSEQTNNLASASADLSHGISDMLPLIILSLDENQRMCSFTPETGGFIIPITNARHIIPLKLKPDGGRIHN